MQKGLSERTVQVVEVHFELYRARITTVVTVIHSRYTKRTIVFCRKLATAHLHEGMFKILFYNSLQHRVSIVQR